MRPLLNRLASEVRLAQRVVCQQRMMGGYAEASQLTVREKVQINNADIDSLPSPSGDWATENGKAQARYNISLGASIALFLGAGYFFLSLKLVNKPDPYVPVNIEEVFQARLAAREGGES